MSVSVDVSGQGDQPYQGSDVRDDDESGRGGGADGVGEVFGVVQGDREEGTVVDGLVDAQHNNTACSQ